jgi:hypothetical protein
MEDNHPGREERETSCPQCGALIQYSLDSSATANGSDSLKCPSCGNAVRVEGADPKLLEFGPGQGQHGA